MIELGADVSRKLSEMENKDEILRQLRAELAKAAEDISRRHGFRRSAMKPRAKLEKLVEAEINELAMKAQFSHEVSGTDEEANWTAADSTRCYT